jgi:hypothetical protein
MRVVLALILMLALVVSGCAPGQKPGTASDASPRAVTAATASASVLIGSVSRVEPIGRFVVLSFPSDRMPVVDQHLGLYRNGAKIGEVKVSGPQRDNNIVADIVTGAPEVGDEARAD